MGDWKGDSSDTKLEQMLFLFGCARALNSDYIIELLQQTVTYEDMIDHRSYTHNLGSSEIKT